MAGEQRLLSATAPCFSELNHELLLRAAEKGDYTTLETLIEKGVDVDFCDINFHGLDGPWFGYKAIEWASKNGHDNCVELLVKAGADVNDSVALECTALEGHHKCMDVLIKAGANVDTRDEMGYTALMHSAQEGHEKCVDLLIQAGADVNLADDTGYTPIIVAAMSGHDGNVELLINAGSDVNVLAMGTLGSDVGFSFESTTPLMSAAGSKRSLELLIEAGADVNVVNTYGDTSLIKTALIGSPDCVRTLLQAGADVNISNKHDESALMVTAMRNKSLRSDTMDCIRLLLKAGAHVNKRNESGKRAIDCHKLSDKHILRLLEAAGETNERTTKTAEIIMPLKHLCREAIRKHLLDLSPVNLFLTVPALEGELPSSLIPYLLYNVSLEAGRVTTVYKETAASQEN